MHLVGINSSSWDGESCTARTGSVFEESVLSQSLTLERRVISPGSWDRERRQQRICLTQMRGVDILSLEVPFFVLCEEQPHTPVSLSNLFFWAEYRSHQTLSWPDFTLCCLWVPYTKRWWIKCYWEVSGWNRQISVDSQNGQDKKRDREVSGEYEDPGLE